MAGRNKRLAHGAGCAHGLGAIPMDADAVKGGRDARAVAGDQAARLDHRHHMRARALRIVQHRTGNAARSQLPVGFIGAVGEDLERDAQPRLGPCRSKF